MENCIFCQIVNKKSPAYIIAENKNALAFLDIHPVANGHTIIISKKHYVDWQHTPLNVLKDIVALSQEVVEKLDNVFKPFGYNYISNQGSMASQVIFHVHFHVIPKYYYEQGFKIAHGEIKTQEVEKIYQQLQKKHHM